MQNINLQYRYLEERDCPTVNEWLKGWKLNELPLAMYPTTGLVLFDQHTHTPIYAGFVWTSNSKLAQIGFITRNPFFKTKLPQNTRQNFLKELMEYAKDLGYDYIITWAENPLLINDFKGLGMVESSEKCSELIVNIK